MCGLCGIYHLQNQSLSASKEINRMTESLSHRGPDEKRLFEEGPLALGHCRLKVIDLEGGAQPMTGQDGQVTVVFNGEIYNFRELRDELEKKGRHFVSRSDTESLLQLYQEKGAGCLSELEGMFAFALYDRRLKKLLLAVDRFGKKPLYYTKAGSLFVFASELKGLLSHPGVGKAIDPVALTEYLAFEYVPAPRTILEGIQKLEAGTSLEVSSEGILKKRYFRHDFSVIRKSSADWAEQFNRNFERSVGQRLVSDVPLGVFLSGGLDSSSVLSMACRLNPGRKIKTFTIEFDDPSFDESVYAKKVSDYFQTEHVSQRCTLDQMLKEHERILGWLDEPLADASFIPTFMLCRMARQHVTVALSGDGGDELFMGYPTFQAHELAQKADRLPKGLLSFLQLLVNCLPTSMDNLSLDFRLKQFFKGLSYPAIVRDQVWLGSFSEKEQMEILEENLHDKVSQCQDLLKTCSAEGDLEPLKRLQNFYFNFYLQGDILVKVDRASMANSLEVRSPLLDDRLVQSMLGISPALNVSGSSGKGIFKKAMKGRLPEGISGRPKRGFGIPIAKWIRQDLRTQFEQVLSPARLRKDGLFKSHQVQSILAEHISGKKDNRKQLWTLYVFEIWKRKYLG